MDQLQQMAIDTDHLGLFENVLGIPDTDGNTILSAASKNNCPEITSHLIKRGADYNQENDKGATPAYHASNSKFGQHAYSRILRESKFKSKYKSPRFEFDLAAYMAAQRVQRVQRPQRPLRPLRLLRILYPDDLEAEAEAEAEPEPPKKKLKRSLYKQQFGRR
jgi:hypothetical protein